jgi:cleavage and polyadenylation specificity factor subunit 5
MSTVPQPHTHTSHPPTIPLEFTSNQPPTIRLYPLSNYTFSTRDAQPEEDPSVSARLSRLQQHYTSHGMRRTCEAILLCHEHNHPQVLMLQIANAFFKLPGSYLPPSASEIEGFTDILNDTLSPTSPAATDLEWEIGDCIAQWWRPNFETFLYPFLPAHVSRPKELKKLYLIHLPQEKVLAVPKNMKLLAIPLFELYDNTARYGPQLSAIPHYLSKYRFECVNERGEGEYVTPGGGMVGVGDGVDGDKGMNGVKHEGEEEEVKMEQ